MVIPFFLKTISYSCGNTNAEWLADWYQRKRPKTLFADVKTHPRRDLGLVPWWVSEAKEGPAFICSASRIGGRCGSLSWNLFGSQWWVCQVHGCRSIIVRCKSASLSCSMGYSTMLISFLWDNIHATYQDKDLRVWIGCLNFYWDRGRHKARKSWWLHCCQILWAPTGSIEYPSALFALPHTLGHF